MKESPFGFEYSWQDLQPVRVLAICVFVAQFFGAVLGLIFHRFPDWFENLWFGAVVATLPGYLVGLLAQSRSRPGSIKENSTMVRRLGLIAVFLTVIAIAGPSLGMFGK
jgi:hypothetical protein